MTTEQEIRAGGSGSGSEATAGAPLDASSDGASSTGTDAARHATTVIRPSRGWVPVNLRELWDYRELASLLAWRDVKVRYKQTAMGAGWAILQPVFTMLIFTVVFGRFAKLPSDGVPYPVFALAALVPWSYFSQAVSRASTSLVGSSNLVSKVYFPRLIVPLAAAVAPVVDFAIGFVVLLAMMLFYGVYPSWPMLLVPVWLLLTLLAGLAASLWLAALNVKYRDVGHTVPFLVQIWMYASPVAYSLSLVPREWRLIYGLNPMAGIIDAFRWSILGTGSVDLQLLMVGTAVTLVVLAGGLLFFARTERTFADVI